MFHKGRQAVFGMCETKIRGECVEEWDGVKWVGERVVEQIRGKYEKEVKYRVTQVGK